MNNTMVDALLSSLNQANLIDYQQQYKIQKKRDNVLIRTCSKKAYIILTENNSYKKKRQSKYQQIFQTNQKSMLDEKSLCVLNLQEIVPRV